MAGCHDLAVTGSGEAGCARDDLVAGLYRENPLIKQLLGLCSSLAVSTTLFSSAAMGAAVISVLVTSSLVVSLLRKAIPADVRLPMKIVVIATSVTVTERFMAAYAPEAHRVLGVYLPLIVVNCIILGRAEAFAHAHGPLRSVADALGQGLGYSAVLALIGAIREVLGSGTIMSVRLFGAGFEPVIFFALPGGAFFLMGLLMGAASAYDRVRERKARAAELAARAESLAAGGEAA